MLWSLSLRRASGTFFSVGRKAGLAVGVTDDLVGLTGCVGPVAVSDDGSGAVVCSSPLTRVVGSGALVGWRTCTGGSLGWFAGVEASGALVGWWVWGGKLGLGGWDGLEGRLVG